MIFIILLFILLLILFFPINLKGKLIYDIFLNKGYVSFYFFKLKVNLLKIKFVPFKFVIKDKNKDINIIDFKNQTNFSDIFIGQLMKKVKLRNFRCYSNFGFNKDCLISSLGSVILFFGSLILSGFVLSKNSSDNLTCATFANYNKSNLIFCLTSSIVFNLFVVIYCFFISIFIKIKKEI